MNNLFPISDSCHPLRGIIESKLIFFSTEGKGLTSTSANHIANLAKEMVRGIEASLKSLTLYSKSVALIGSEKSDLLSRGNTSEQLAEVTDKLSCVAKANSLIAWLREAIAAKESLLAVIQNLDTENYCKFVGKEYPEEPEMDETTVGRKLTESDYIASLSIDRRNQYFQAQATAAVFGKAIHQGGSFASAREALMKIIETPREVEGDGRDTLIYSFTPSVEPKEVNDLYFHLQNCFREAQAIVNKFNHECQTAVKESEIAYTIACNKIREDYEQKQSLLRDQRDQFIKEKMKEIGDYKIIIPQSLREIYDTVSHLGKGS